MKLILALALALSTTTVFANTVTLVCHMTPAPNEVGVPTDANYIIDYKDGTVNGIPARVTNETYAWSSATDYEILDRPTGNIVWYYPNRTTMMASGNCIIRPAARF